ncbi:MAG: NADH:flavin oxidoreductase [Syntrophales bacterium]|nr:NADH:flavin oxidoreductase [Syntrophales bacterium]MDD5642033.1 NADH:flavin oxidoreductase [Syntrophales bacterium]
MHPLLFSGIDIAGLKLKNRITMAPLYLGYAGEGGTVSPLLLDHYRLMAQSGAALVVVENASVDHPAGSGAHRMIRADTDKNLEGLAQLAETIKEQGARAALQINHAGRFAAATEQVAPSPVETFGRRPRALTREEIQALVEKFAAAAMRVKRAGFDLVELHGGTGYLLAQFVSPRTNRREDDYGGPLENRMKFPLEVVAAVKAAVGDFPVGYRFLAEEWLSDGLQLGESLVFARALAAAGIAYLSVMGGTYESFFLPEVMERSKQPGFMVDLAAAIKTEVRVPVITAGRINTGALAESILAQGRADLIGLARVLWADPEWPEKVRRGREAEIIHCEPGCDACMQLVMKGKPALCMQWPKTKLREWKARLTLFSN